MHTRNIECLVDRKSEKIFPTKANVFICRTPVVDRSNDSRFPSGIRSQSSCLGIVVSVDQRQRVSNRNSNYNQRTSTPIRPSCQSQSVLIDDCIDSFTVDSISRDTYDMLSRFPEFRRLLKAFNNEKKKSLTWSKDFARLQTNYKKLEENSFRTIFFFSS